MKVTGIKPLFHLNNDTLYNNEELNILSQLHMLNHIRTVLITK